MDSVYTAVHAILIPGSVRPRAQYQVISNRSYRNIHQAGGMPADAWAPIRDAEYIGNQYEATGWALVECRRIDMAMWLAVLAVLDTAIDRDMHDTVPDKHTEAHAALLKHVFPDGYRMGSQWHSGEPELRIAERFSPEEDARWEEGVRLSVPTRFSTSTLTSTVP